MFLNFCKQNFAFNYQESQRQGRIDVHIKKPFHFVIPNFPIMAVELIKVQFHIHDNVLNGVIDAKRYPNLRLGVYACTSYCDIMIEGEKYVVLWELSCYKPLASDNTSSDHDSDDENMHCLPFKVVGTLVTHLQGKKLFKLPMITFIPTIGQFLPN